VVDFERQLHPETMGFLVQKSTAFGFPISSFEGGMKPGATHGQFGEIYTIRRFALQKIKNKNNFEISEGTSI